MASRQALKTGHSISNDYDEKEIWLYKVGSRGQIVGIYQDVSEIVEIEKRFNKKFHPNLIYNCFIGRQNSFTSFNHQCRVKPVLKPKR